MCFACECSNTLEQKNCFLMSLPGGTYYALVCWPFFFDYFLVILLWSSSWNFLKNPQFFWQWTKQPFSVYCQASLIRCCVWCVTSPTTKGLSCIFWLCSIGAAWTKGPFWVIFLTPDSKSGSNLWVFSPWIWKATLLIYFRGAFI
jgi:hypothetical protein